MNTPLRITKIGNSSGIVLPKELLAQVRLGIGDTLYLSDTPKRIQITATSPDLAAKMAVADQIMREDRELLRALAQ